MNHINHSHGHHHSHGGSPDGHASISKLKTAFLFTLLILVVELGGGLLSHSLALLSDAGHVLTDVAAISLSWYALVQTQKPADEKMTFGYQRSGILAAMINAMALIAIALVVLWQAFGRFHHPEVISSKWMLISASVGFALNLYLGLGMHHDKSMNIQSTVLHILGDAAASAGVIIGSIVIMFTGWNMIDPILSVCIALLIAVGAVKIVKQSTAILLEGAPIGIELQKVVQAVRSIRDVIDVHDVHVWSISDGQNAVSCHVVLDGSLTIHGSQSILRNIEEKLFALEISHVTIQTEDFNHPHEDSVYCHPANNHDE